MTPAAALTALIEKRDLEREEMLSVMQQIMTGDLTPVQIAGILIALRAKGETVTEIAAAAEVMRQLAAKVPTGRIDGLVDTCGTGGDGAHTFNISTASALVAAAAGACVAKHGGRSVSSSCGSADVLEALGVNLNLTPEQVARSVEEVGVGFMFAPNHHSAMRFAAPVRKELGVRTLFNLLGPLTNPAGARNQVMGVFRRELVGKLAHVLQALGSRHVLVVNGDDGMDEISITGDTHVAELKDGAVREYVVNPRDFGIAPQDVAAIKVRDRAEAVDKLHAVLENQPGTALDIVTLNAGAAIYVSGVAPSLAAGVDKAAAVIASGAVKAKLAQLIAFTRRYASATA